jgi:hypothetical protein
MGCYVDKTGQPQDACVISHDYAAPNTYYIFNHVDIIIRLQLKCIAEWRYKIPHSSQDNKFTREIYIFDFLVE